MKISEPALLDTNILVYAHNQNSPHYKKASNIIKSVLEGKIKASITHQNLLEFYSIVTDFRRVKKPLTSTQALDLVRLYIGAPFTLIFPTDETIYFSLEIASKLKAKDGQIFDIYLMATMLSNKIETIITSNVKDFKSVEGIRVLDLQNL